VAQSRRTWGGFSSDGFGRHEKMAPVGRIGFGINVPPIVISASTGPPDLELTQTINTKIPCNPLSSLNSQFACDEA